MNYLVEDYTSSDSTYEDYFPPIKNKTRVISRNISPYSTSESYSSSSEDSIPMRRNKRKDIIDIDSSEEFDWQGYHPFGDETMSAEEELEYVEEEQLPVLQINKTSGYDEDLSENDDILKDILSEIKSNLPEDFVSRTYLPPWLKQWANKKTINRALLLAVTDARLWSKIRPVISEIEHGIARSDKTPYGVREQLGIKFDCKKLVVTRHKQSNIPEEIIFNIIFNINPYDLVALSLVDKLFYKILSNRKNLDTIADIWHLPRASSLKHLADLWKTLHVTREYKKYNSPNEIAMYCIAEYDVGIFEEILKSIRSNVMEYLIALTLIYNRQKIRKMIYSKKDKMYISKNLLLFLCSEKYYDKNILEEYISHVKSDSLGSMAKIIKCVEDHIPEEAFIILYTRYANDLLFENGWFQNESTSEINNLKLEIITNVFRTRLGIKKEKDEFPPKNKYLDGSVPYLTRKILQVKSFW